MVKIEIFEQRLTEYYGKAVNDFVRKTTIDYVSKTYEEKALGILISGIMKSHPSNWGFPDIAAIEKAHDKMGKEKFPADVKKPGDKNYWTADLSITDEEWKQGFKGMEELKAAVNFGFEESTEKKQIEKLDPEQMEQARQELENMK